PAIAERDERGADVVVQQAAEAAVFALAIDGDGVSGCESGRCRTDGARSGGVIGEGDGDRDAQAGVLRSRQRAIDRLRVRGDVAGERRGGFARGFDRSFFLTLDARPVGIGAFGGGERGAFGDGGGV